MSAIRWLTAGWIGVVSSHAQAPTPGPSSAPPPLTAPTLAPPTKPPSPLAVPGLPAAIKVLKSHLPTPAPGTYVTEPFKCIVIVPGGNLDPAMILSPPPNGCILQTRPALRFIPRHTQSGPSAR